MLDHGVTRLVNPWLDLKALLHFHGSHHGSSRILIRGVPACDTTISSRCRCGYVPNWVYTRASTVSPRTDKVATRTTPETHTELTRISRKSTEATGYLLRSLYGGVRCLLGYLRNVDG